MPCCPCISAIVAQGAGYCRYGVVVHPNVGEKLHDSSNMFMTVYWDVKQTE